VILVVGVGLLVVGSIGLLFGKIHERVPT